MNTMDRGRIAFVLAAFAALAFYPLVAGDYGLGLVNKIMIYAILALSLELLVGSTGLVCFGQAAFFGIGAYGAVLLASQGAPSSVLWLLPASMAHQSVNPPTTATGLDRFKMVPSPR